MVISHLAKPTPSTNRKLAQTILARHNAVRAICTALPLGVCRVRVCRVADLVLVSLDLSSWER